MTSRAFKITFVLFLGFSNWAFAWQPDGSIPKKVTRACHPQLWNQRYLDTRDSIERASLMKEYLANCADPATANQPQGRAAEEHLMSLVDRDRGWEEINFLDTAGFIQTGHLLLQSRAGPRPLVVVACDFDCDPRSNPWLKTVALQLYDEGGAHIYIAHSPESRLSKQSLWISGGLNYGRELLEAGRWLQLFSPYRGKFSSSHLLGLGWAAKSVLDGQLLNDRNPIADDRRVFHSTVALCPAVNLQHTLNQLDEPTNEETLSLKSAVNQRMALLKSVDANWGNWLSGWSPGSPVGEPWLAASLAQTAQPSFPWLNPFRGSPPKTRAAWLEANDFVYQSLGLKTPGWVLGASNDPRFAAAQHWLPLAEQHQDLKKSALRVFGINESSTCALPSSHGWSFSSALLRTLVLQEAYEIWPRYGAQRIAWQNSATPELGPTETHHDQQWRVAQDGSISVEFFISSDETSTRSVVVAVPRDQLPKSLKYDSSNSDVATRQLNVWLRLRGPTEALVQSREAVRFLEIRD